MALTNEQIVAIRDSMRDHALTLGIFDQVSGHEPKAAPGRGVTLEYFADYLGPLRRGSGLASTSALLVWSARMRIPMLREPQDDIETDILAAGSALVESYSADFGLTGLDYVRAVDLLGIQGRPMEIRFGYLEHDKVLYRTGLMPIPLMINDAWPQGA